MSAPPDLLDTFLARTESELGMLMLWHRRHDRVIDGEAIYDGHTLRIGGGCADGEDMAVLYICEGGTTMPVAVLDRRAASAGELWFPVPWRALERVERARRHAEQLGNTSDWSALIAGLDHEQLDEHLVLHHHHTGELRLYRDGRPAAEFLCGRLVPGHLTLITRMLAAA